MQHPKEFYQVSIWYKKYKPWFISGFTDPFGKKKIPGHSLITNKIEEKFRGYLRHFYQYAVRMYTNEALFQNITDAMMKILREEGELRDSIELR